MASIVGSVTEKGLLDRAYRDPSVVERTVGEVMDRPLPAIDAAATLDDAFALLTDGGAQAVVAIRDDRPLGVLTRLDLLESLASRGSRPA
jgi:cystathionine beta-synthase